MDTKYIALIKALKAQWSLSDIDFTKDVEDTKWRIEINKQFWYPSTIKSKILPLPETTPEVLDHCHCGTPINTNCLIKHIPSNQYAIVGNICIRRCGAVMKRRCIDCHEINNAHSLRCANCRVECINCKEYHDDNNNCFIENYDDLNITKLEISISDKSKIFNLIDKMNFTYGVHKGKTPDELLGEFDGYLIWIANTPKWSNKEQREYIIENLLSKCCQSKFKKYPTKTLSWLKANETEYFEYMQSSDTGCYLDLVI